MYCVTSEPEPAAPDQDDQFAQLTADLRVANQRIDELEAELEMERSKPTEAASDEMKWTPWVGPRRAVL